MIEKTMRILEYNKIITRLSGLCLSPMGSEIAESLLPSSNIDEVRQMQEETDEAVKIMLSKGSIPFEGLQDIREGIKKLGIGSILQPSDLLKIADQLRCARRLKNFLSGESEDEYHILYDLADGIVPLKKIEDEIYSCIISEDEVSDNASPALNNIRRQIRDKNSAIRDKLNSIIRSQNGSKALQESIITVRGDRFVVPVKSEYRGSFPGLVHDQSASGSTLFIEPMAVVEMNNDIKQLKAKEKAELERILSQLTVMVYDNIDSLKINNEILSELDFIFGKARLSLDLKCMPPSINDGGYIYIKRGRHPLIDPKVVVPNNITIGNGISTLVITGPNTGGKTVTLKTLGLLTLMAMAGLQIPADEGSDISVFDQVFADIGDEQSIEQSLSTFSSHMTNIVEIMKEATSNSLVLFDELGAGTDPTEGAALAMAILDDLYSRGTKVAATTHYSELKVFALQREGIENASVEFDVETLRPTYKLFIGIPGKSNAFEISKRLGLSEIIIENAKGLLSSQNVQFEDLISNLQHNKIAAENEREEAEKIRRNVQKLQNEVESRREKLDREREAVLNKARQEAKKLVKEARDEAENIIKEIREAAQIQEEAERNRKIEEARKKLKNKLDVVEDSLAESLVPRRNLKPLKNVKPGDRVFIVTLNQMGNVLTYPDSKGEVTVQVGIMKINVHLSNLSIRDDEQSSMNFASSVKITADKSKMVGMSIDVRGQTLDEAIMNVDKYLDDAYLASLNEVTIIHGKGTGVLRQGINDMLKHHSHVKTYRPGKYGEGGTGVTVVEIKR